MIKRKVGERISITGGAEQTPTVIVDQFNEPGSLHNGDKTLLIVQGDRTARVAVTLSLETMKQIITWAESED